MLEAKFRTLAGVTVDWMLQRSMFQVPMRPTKRKLKEGEQIVILKFSVPGPQGLFKKKREIGQYNLIPCGFPYATLFFFFFKFTLCFSKCLSSGWNTSFLVDGEHLMKKKKKRPGNFPSVFLSTELMWGNLETYSFGIKMSVHACRGKEPMEMTN